MALLTKREYDNTINNEAVRKATERQDETLNTSVLPVTASKVKKENEKVYVLAHPDNEPTYKINTKLSFFTDGISFHLDVVEGVVHVTDLKEREALIKYGFIPIREYIKS